MNLIKNIFLVMLCVVFSLSAVAQRDNTGTYIDQEVIPYGFLQLNPGLVYSHFSEYKFETQMTRRTVTGMGIGMEAHFPLIYLLAHNTERRFRIADDLGLGTYMISNKVKREDALTNASLPNTEINSKLNGSIIFYAGLQAVFRISKTFDVGVKYYPLFLHYDFMNPGAFGQTFGFTARIQRLYIDCRMTKKKNKDLIVNKGLRTITMRYSVHPFDSDKRPKYLFLTYSSYTFQYNIFPQPARPPGYENYQLKNSNWTLIEFGWAMGF
jgi:hypothetical protein